MATQYPVQAVCEALDVSRSGFYANRKKPQLPRRRADQVLEKRVREVFEKGRKAYGSPRVHAALHREGIRCGKKRVARIMRDGGLKAHCKRKFKPPRTTDSRHNLPVAPNWPAKIPKPNGPNQIWTSDITYIQTSEGWLFLAAVMDLYSRQIIAWSVAPTLHAQLPQKAIIKAIESRGTHPGLIHHSDRGVQYASNEFRLTLAKANITQSMSRKANCYDNAAMESFFATLKTESPAKHPFPDRKTAETAIFQYIETFYNPARIHSALGFVSPIEFEKKQP